MVAVLSLAGGIHYTEDRIVIAQRSRPVPRRPEARESRVDYENPASNRKQAVFIVCSNALWAVTAFVD